MTEISTISTTATDLIAVISGVRRALRRQVDRTGGLDELSDAQREVVRVVRRRPGVGVGDAASELHLAPNTISTLVSGLGAAGWLRREVDPADRRSARLFLTDGAESRVAAWRDRRQGVLSEALAALPADDQEQIQRAIPALGRLLRELERCQ